MLQKPYRISPDLHANRVCRISIQPVSQLYVSVEGYLKWARPPEAPLWWDLLLCWMLTCSKTDNLDIKMLWGKSCFDSWRCESRACRDAGPICDLSAGPVMYCCGLDSHSQGCVLLLSVPWHSGHFNPQSLLTGTPQPATVRYSFTATLVFIISAARPH